MRAVAVVAALLPLLAACEPPPAPTPGTAAVGNVIVVRNFRVTSETRVVVDTSFGFSLYRGHPGVPLRQRAAGLSRAAAFDVADALTRRLRQLGYAAYHAEPGSPDPGGKAAIVVGTLREVNEGHRRRVGDEHARVAVDAEVDAWGPGIRPIEALHVDSAELSDDGMSDPSGGAPALGVAAARVGRELARSVAAVAGRIGVTPITR
ncbi:MAG TPA: hypothetical protein VND87_08715 [Stellaceae bacterium]|nr:hypothetical protein [Stellaceae bacterium]